jgi:hypothetical protein
MFLWCASTALAGSTTSVNWAGYAAHRTGVHFRRVTAEWQVPSASCTPGVPGYSSLWVGLGGYSSSSNALEQTGVEVDCSSSGRGVYYAWYELVPAPPKTIPLSVRPGDLIRATVGASGGRVTITLADLTRRRTFQRSFHPSQLDTTAADWILEAPSACTNGVACFTLPLADFGRAAFQAAHAATTQGRGGAITSRLWNTTKITLVASGSRFFAGTGAGSPDAVPSALASGGSAFTVTFEGSSQSAPSGPFFGAGDAHRVVGRVLHLKR